MIHAFAHLNWLAVALAALVCHEEAGHLAVTELNALALRLVSGDGQSDPAAQLAKMLDKATHQIAGRDRRRRIAGLIATSAHPIPDDMQTALDDRQAIIEAQARQIAREAQEPKAAWIVRLGKPPTEARARARW